MRVETKQSKEVVVVVYDRRKTTGLNIGHEFVTEERQTVESPRLDMQQALIV